MRKLLFLTVIILSFNARAQQISFQQNYPTGPYSRATAFLELRSFDLLVAYTYFQKSPSFVLEMHLMKTDRNGIKLWDKVVRVDTPQTETERFSTQSIAEQNDGSILMDVIYPYGEKYILKLDAEGNQLWETYLHNSFGDYDVYSQIIKQRSKNIMLGDGSSLILGAAFLSVNPKATMIQLDAAGIAPFEHYFYRGYFNDGYYFNEQHLYTVGVEQTDTNENLVFSDLRADGMVNYHKKIVHKRNEKVLATALYHSSTKFRVAESISQKDTGWLVNVYDFQNDGVLLNKKTYKMSCSLSNLQLENNETSWVLSRKCQSFDYQIIEKHNDQNGWKTFSFKSTFDNVMQLQKIHDDAYVFIFNNTEGVNLWKINMAGSSRAGNSAEGHFAPNPMKDITTFIHDKDTYGKSMSVRIFDSYGHSMGSYDFGAYEAVSIDLGRYASGIYPYKLILEDGSVIKGKLVKFGN